MSGHTPGPWEIRRSKSGYPYQIHAPNGIDGPGGIKDVTRWASIAMPSSPEGEANARLIAAAPSLLEALKELADLMDATYEHDYVPDSFTTQPARTAIRLAENTTDEAEADE
jgi:hypothetical protein